MNYCFLARPSMDKFAPLMFRDIKVRYDEKALGVFITTNGKETATVRSIIPDAIVYETSTYMREHRSEFTHERLCYYEKKYECAPIWKYIYTDRFLIHRDYDYVIKITAGLFSFFEEIFTKHNIDVYYSEAISTLQCYVAYLVGRKTGARYFAQIDARCVESFHYVLEDPFQRMSQFNDNYTNSQYTDEEWHKADEFLSAYERHEDIPESMVVDDQKPKLKYIALPLIRILKRFDSNYNNPYSYMYYESYKNVTDPIKFYFRYQCSKKYYNKADYSKKYVYFPLHYQPEASTIVCAQKYEKQSFFIDSWAKSLPADTVLYVKEHYVILGHRDPQFYKELKKYPNVVLIDPLESSRKLSMHAVAVTTLTGTAGFEAMLLRKPVILGGDIFFDKAPGVIKVSDIYGNYLDIINNWKQPTREEVLRYLCAYFRAIAPGRIYGTSESTEENNIRLFVDSLMKNVKKSN